MSGYGSPALAGTTNALPETGKRNRGVAAYWMPRMRGACQQGVRQLLENQTALSTSSRPCGTHNPGVRIERGWSHGSLNDGHEWLGPRLRGDDEPSASDGEAKSRGC